MTTNTDNTKKPVSIAFSGSTLLSMSLLNKGCAFSDEERQAFNLTGLLPRRHETLEQQVERAYIQYSSFDEPINKHIYLRATQDSNETLFYRLVEEHLEEMMPIIYTPVVGEACERFSEIYRRTRGLFIAYPDRHHIDEMLANVTKNNIKVIVVTDGSRILGLGDQGIGGMGIPIGKLSLYTACAGVSPAYTLPIMLDVGTNNHQLLEDPLYMGWHHKRIEQQEYDEFLDLFVTAIKKRWPEVLLQFEDFEQTKALPLLTRYRDQLCCFNDDIQGTASVTVGTLLAACKVNDTQLSQQKVVFVGAGAAGCGIAEQIVDQMCKEGLSEQQARSQIYMVGRYGLLTEDSPSLLDFQKELAQKQSNLTDWQYTEQYAPLIDVLQFAKPTILIGVSGQPGLFTESVIKTMVQGCSQPIILPLSNPSRKIEATPQQLIEWTDGQAIIATGSPFEPVEYKGNSYIIPQCNNSYIFPGFGLAVMAGKITRISDEMMMVASEVLAQASPLATTGEGSLLPPLTEIAKLSKKIAFEVAKLAQQQGFADETSDQQLMDAIEQHFWLPEYREYKRMSV
ncbi:MAG: NAD-dependent malic enzyme [Gammaproteobacteria bacterium]|nr:MAG: NAD-dependent malic enzyme [Gammaproteobacteria bacterium]RKZ96819.1 MAG: NAD-dependent malic enzyme [Gammaproteobacteria bacterium]